MTLCIASFQAKFDEHAQLRRHDLVDILNHTDGWTTPIAQIPTLKYYHWFIRRRSKDSDLAVIVDEAISILSEDYMFFVELEHLYFEDQLLTTAQI